MAMFSKATKKQLKLRLALVGPSGSGKTYTALLLASRLGKRVAVIDTERGSASKYADLFAFDVLELTTYSPNTYIKAVQAAEVEGYDVIVLDSLSHAWTGKEGALELVDRATKRSQNTSTFFGWREVTPQHNALVDAVVGCKAHVIATMRAKTEYVLEKDRDGKTVPRKVGLAPVQRDGMEYEFDVVGDMTADNEFIVSKTRCPALSGQIFPKPGANVAKILMDWLGEGSPLAKLEQTAQRTPELSKPSETLEPDFEGQIRSAVSIEPLKAISAEVAKCVPKGDPRRPKLAKLIAERKIELEKTAVRPRPDSNTTDIPNGALAQENAA